MLPYTHRPSQLLESGILQSVLGTVPSVDLTGRSASPFRQSRRSPAASRIGSRSVSPPLAIGPRVSLPISIALTGTGAFPRVALSGVATSAPSLGSVALPAILEDTLLAAPGTVVEGTSSQQPA